MSTCLDPQADLREAQRALDQITARPSPPQEEDALIRHVLCVTDGRIPLLIVQKAVAIYLRAQA